MRSHTRARARARAHTHTHTHTHTGMIEGRAAGSRVLVVGIGKSGHLARKIAATLSSTGTASFFMHGTEALHGDLGGAQAGDVAILISNSGETDEIQQAR